MSKPIDNSETPLYNKDGETKFSELSLSNTYMFGRVMRRPKVCKLFLEALLGIKIADIKYIDTEKDLSSTLPPQYHGIRLDVFVEDENRTRYNVEMQQYKEPALERRCRYYQNGLDRDFLEKGKTYEELPESYVIFVCSADYFGAGLACYRRESHFVGAPDVKYNDGSHVIILNAQYKTQNVSPDIDEFLSFVRAKNGADNLDTPLGAEVLNALTSVRNDSEEERGYMTLLEYGRQQLNQGRAEGKREGVVSVVKALLKTMSPEQVARATELPLEEVEHIAKQ